MSFPKGQYGFKTITEDLVVTMENWIEPVLTNNGDQNVVVHGRVIPPGENFAIGATGIQLSGQLDIRFEGAGQKLAHINYNQIKCK